MKRHSYSKDTTRQTWIRALTLFTGILAIMLFSGCSKRVHIVLIQSCFERPRDIANAYKYTDQTPLTAEGLKNLIAEDTIHYKVVLIHSLCCGACHERLQYVYSKLWDQDTAQVRWYFVLQDCSSLKHDHTNYLKMYGIETPYMYYLRDDNPRFCRKAEDRNLNLAQYVFDRQPDLEDVINGVPTVFIVNPQGKLMTEYRRYADGTVVLGNAEWVLNDLVYSKLTKNEIIPRDTLGKITDLDFNQRDTVDFSDYGNYTRKPKARVCTAEGCY